MPFRIKYALPIFTYSYSHNSPLLFDVIFFRNWL